MTEDLLIAPADRTRQQSDQTTRPLSQLCSPLHVRAARAASDDTDELTNLHPGVRFGCEEARIEARDE
jgi:hypothetical protein